MKTRTLAWDGLLLFAATFVVNGANYGFHFVVSRRIDAASYGDLYALLTAMGLIGLLGTAAETVVVRLIAASNGARRSDVVAAITVSASRWGTLGAIILAAALAVSGAYLSDFLRIGDRRDVIPWALLVAVSLISVILRAVLQGLHQFGRYTISTAIEAVAKVILGGAAAYYGLGAYGILVALAIAASLSVIYTGVALRRRLAGTTSSSSGALPTAHFIRTSAGVLLSTLATTALLSTDLLLAKHYLSPAEAGLYSAVSLAGKVLLFAVGFVPRLALPKITDAVTRGERATGIALSGGAFTILACGLLIALYALFPAQILRLFVGSAYLAASPFVVLYAIAMGLLALTTVVVAYKIAVHDFGYVVPLALVAAAEVVAVGVHHSDALAILHVLIATQAAAFLVSIAAPRRIVAQASAGAIPRPA